MQKIILFIIGIAALLGLIFLLASPNTAGQTVDAVCNTRRYNDSRIYAVDIFSSFSPFQGEN